jgi:hypothetical protein
VQRFAAGNTVILAVGTAICSRYQVLHARFRRRNVLVAEEAPAALYKHEFFELFRHMR